MHMAARNVILLDDSASDEDEELPRVSHLIGSYRRSPVENRVSKEAPGVRTSQSTEHHAPVAHDDSPPPLPPTLPAIAEKQKKGRKRKVDKEPVNKRKEPANKTKVPSKPCDKHKQMIVLIDTAVSENAAIMSELAPQLLALNVTYRVSDLEPHGSVRWRRKTHADDQGPDPEEPETEISEEEVKHLIVALEGVGFFALVHHTKLQNQSGPLPLPPGAKTLQSYVTELQQENPGYKITLVVEGLEAAFRGRKTKKNRHFREAVRTGRATGDLGTIGAFSDVSRLDCEEAMVGLQVTTGCSMRLCEEPALVSELIVTYTKALAEAPYRKDNIFSFFSDLGPGATKKALKETEDKVSLIWLHQLLQLPTVSNPTATAIVAAYPSPAHLLRAYECTHSKKEAETLLEDTQVRRGTGVTASIRRVGPCTSRRIHQLLTVDDPNTLLT